MLHIRINILLIIILLLAPSVLLAETCIRGRVVAVDREKGQFTFAPMLQRQCNLPGEIKEPEVKKQEPLVISSEHIPPFVKPDKLIRVLGNFSETAPRHFQAIRIAGPGKGRMHDSTGVRSRLRKRCLFNQQHHPKKQHHKP